MNKYLIILKKELTKEIKRDLEQMGIHIAYYYEYIPDMVFTETSLKQEEVLQFDIVSQVIEPILPVQIEAE